MSKFKRRQPQPKSGGRYTKEYLHSQLPSDEEIEEKRKQDLIQKQRDEEARYRRIMGESDLRAAQLKRLRER